MSLNTQTKTSRDRPACDSPLAGLTKHRRFNSAIAKYLHTDPLSRDTALAIANCSQRLSLQFQLDGNSLGEPELVNGILCNRRLCPFCEWRRTRIWRARLIKGLHSHAAENPKTSAIFLTLTMRNCQISELREQIQHLHSSFKRLSLIKGFPSATWFRRTEITIGKGNGVQETLISPQFHPHIHALLLVKPSYWSRGYWSQLKWKKEWQMAARLDYSPVIDIRRARSKNTSKHSNKDRNLAATLEAAKYSTKASDLIKIGSHLPDFNSAVRSLRLYGLSSKLRDYVNSADISADQLLDAVDSPSGQSFTAVAKWFEAIQEYRFDL